MGWIGRRPYRVVDGGLGALLRMRDLGKRKEPDDGGDGQNQDGQFGETHTRLPCVISAPSGTRRL